MIKTKLILVLGCHRSGTSVITHALEVLGVNLSPVLMHPGNDNLRGFFEDEDLMNVHDDLFGSAETSWSTTNLFTADFLHARADDIDTLTKIVKDKVIRHKIFAFKDPRMSVLLPLWHKVLERFPQIETTYVVCVRHPYSVLGSLQKRDGKTFKECLKLWFSHTFCPLSDTPRRIVVDFDRVIEHPKRELDRLANFFALSRPDKITVDQFTERFLDPSLRHHAHTSDDIEYQNLSTAWKTLSAMASDECAPYGDPVEDLCTLFNWRPNL